MSTTTTLRLVLGDQLNAQHRWFTEVDDAIVYVLMEVRQETDYVLHHAQKILAIFAAMRDFARQLREAGHRVHYIAIDQPHSARAMTGQSRRAGGRTWRGLGAIPGARRVAARPAAVPARPRRQVPWLMVDTDHFYTGRA